MALLYYTSLRTESDGSESPKTDSSQTLRLALALSPPSIMSSVVLSHFEPDNEVHVNELLRQRQVSAESRRVGEGRRGSLPVTLQQELRYLPIYS